MLGDQLGKEVLSITVGTAKITLGILKTILNAINKHIDNSKTSPKISRGYQSLKELNKQDQELHDMPLSKKDLKYLKRELKSYGIDFAIKKNPTQPESYTLYFKGKDAAQIQNALKNCVAKQFAKSQKPSLKERIKNVINKHADKENEYPNDKTKDKSYSR